MAKITEEFLKKELRHYQDLWANTHMKWRRIDQYITNTLNIWEKVPRAQQRAQFHSSRAANIVEQAVATLLGITPRVSKNPAGQGQTHKDAANRTENGLREILLDSSKKALSLPYKRAPRYGVQYGYMVLQTAIDPDDWDVLFGDEPTRETGEDEDRFRRRHIKWSARRQNVNPFRIQAPHPARVLSEPCEKEPSVAFKWSKRYIKDLNNLLQRKIEQGKVSNKEVFSVDNLEPFALVDVVERWDEEEHTMFLVGTSDEDGKTLFTEENTWDLVPFATAFSGFGSEITDMEVFDPQYEAVGLLDSVLESIKGLWQSMAAKHNALIEDSYRRMRTRQDPAAVAEQMDEDIIQGEPGDPDWMPGPELQQHHFLTQELFERDIELGTFNLTLAGHKEPGVNTATQQIILSNAASNRFREIGEQQNNIASLQASHILRIVDLMNTPLELNGVKLSPEDIERSYNVRVEFIAVDPVQQAQTQQVMMAEFQAGLASRERYWEATGVEDPTTEKENILGDQADQHPAIQEAMVEAIIRKRGFSEQLEAFKEAQQQAQQQQAQGAGTNGVRR